MYFFLIVINVFPQEHKALKNKIQQFKNSEVVKHAQWSFSAQYVSTGKTIINYNSDAALSPASNLKLVTTAAALDRLGPDFRFKTEIYYDGKIDLNVVQNRI